MSQAEARLCATYKLTSLGGHSQGSSSVIEEWTLELMTPAHFLTMCLTVWCLICTEPQPP